KEGLGVALLEAMASGLAIVATTAGGVREVIRDCESGVLVEPANADQLASALLRLAEHPNLRAALGAAARDTVTQRFSLSAMARTTHQLYTACLERKAAVGKGKRCAA